jgi:uncharacterized radical SAM superfamily Fe-S cluster-containing enzyme
MAELMDVVMQELAKLGWQGFQAVNTRLPEGQSPAPQWAPGPLLKSRQRTKPPLGWPRQTDSLCPRCVIETRSAILSGTRDLADLVDGHVGEIKARILEEDGRLLIRKTCAEHGTFEDVISIDPEFSRKIEARFPGRDFRTLGDELIHRHGSSSIKYGRGAVLTVSFTGRDEEISDEDRRRQRYTISHLAQELQRYYGGKIDPYRDWYPLGAMGQFTALANHLNALKGLQEPKFGGLACSCHPNCGSSVLLVANRKTKEWSAVTQFFNIDQFMQDIALICDTARGQKLTLAQVALSFVRNGGHVAQYR